jgi:hypothetical protein
VLLAQIIYVQLRPSLGEQLLQSMPSVVLALIAALSILDSRLSRKASEKMADAMRLSNVLDHELPKVDLQVAEGGVGAWGVIGEGDKEISLLEQVALEREGDLSKVTEIGCGFVLLLKNFEERAVRVELGSNSNLEKIAILDIAKIEKCQEEKRTKQADLLYNLSARQELANLVKAVDLNPYLVGDSEVSFNTPLILPPRSYVYLHVVVFKSMDFWQKNYERIMDAYTLGENNTSGNIARVSEDEALSFRCDLRVYSLLNPSKVVRKESISFLSLPRVPLKLLTEITRYNFNDLVTRDIDEIFKGVACHPTHTVSFPT